MELYPRGMCFDLVRAVLLKQCALFHRAFDKYRAEWSVGELSVIIYRKHQKPIIKVRDLGGLELIGGIVESSHP